MKRQLNIFNEQMIKKKKMEERNDEDIKYHKDKNGRVYRCYDYIKTKPIERLHYQDEKVDMFIKSQTPVVIEGLDLVGSADKWNLEYLMENLGDDKKNVLLSNSCKFMYHNENRHVQDHPDFKLPTRLEEMSVLEFANRFRSWKPGEDRLYYQQMLTDTVGSKIFEDFNEFRWDWLSERVIKHRWGTLTSNLLLIGQPGNITPVHYDEQQNFFAQVHGYKRVLLFKPKFFQCLYPFPYHHPCDRQSQVDFDNPDFEQFPLMKYLNGYETVVGPGEVLYIPMYWWHYIESTMDSDITTSINFWYKHTTVMLEDLSSPLNWQQKTTITRNIEKMLGEALGSPLEVGRFLNTIFSGRFNLPELSEEDFEEK